MKQTLTLRAAGSALIANIDALHAGATRYIGRRFNRSTMAFESTDLPETITTTHGAYYRTAVQAGDLLPGDAATAELFGVSWNE